MSTTPRRGPRRKGTAPSGRVGLAMLVIAWAVPSMLGASGCRSDAALAFRGARHYAAGSAALERGESEIAVHELRRAAMLVPHASEIQNHLGLAYLANGSEEAARAAFERAVELDCDNRAAQINLDRLRETSQAIDPQAGGPGDPSNTPRDPIRVESKRSGADGG